MVLRRKSPINFILLTLFTLLESYTIGYVGACWHRCPRSYALAFIDVAELMPAARRETWVGLGALCTHSVLFITLTIFTIQTRIDFIGAGP